MGGGGRGKEKKKGISNSLLTSFRVVCIEVPILLRQQRYLTIISDYVS